MRRTRRVLLTVFAFVVCVLSIRPSILAAQSAREDAGRFGKIWIERIRQNDSYMLHLFENPEGNHNGAIYIQCFLGHPEITVMIHHPDDLKQMLGIQHVTMWSDKGDPHDLSFYALSSGALALEIGRPGGTRDSDQTVTQVLAIIERAEHFVAYSIDGETATIDAMHLPAARDRFQELCKSGQMPPPPSDGASTGFRGWKVIHRTGSNLIALMDDSPTPSIVVSCSSSLGAYDFSVRLISRHDVVWDSERKANYFKFLAWSDSGPAQQFTALVPPEMPDFGDLWVSTNPAIHDEKEALWNMFKSAKQEFSYRSVSGTNSVKAGDLQAAVENFETACHTIMPKAP